MNVLPTDIPDAVIIEPKTYTDDRGWFREAWNAMRYSAAGISADFVQDNISSSRRGVLRGLHIQNPHSQGKLVSVPHGAVFDVAVDVRSQSPTFGRWTGAELSAENGRQLYIPEGFAHGFVVLSETALFSYKCTEYYDPASEMCVMWNDPDIAIAWPISNPIVSAKDAAGVRLRDLAPAQLPQFVK
jgi:dTDP-4-dehydrorhamnose 3,5-epimerase